MMNNLLRGAQVAKNLLNVLQRYTKGIRFVAVLLVLFTVSIGTASAEKSIDFESGTATYSDWTFTNMTSKQSGSITAKGGSYYGTTGAKATASIQTKKQISSPKSISCYVSKQTTNTTSSTWYIQTSTNGSSWTDVKTQSATSMSKGSWVEFTADLSSYSNVYVRIYYSGSTAVRNIDNLVLTEGTTTFYDVNWMVNGATYTTGSPTTSVAGGSKVTTLPTNPTLDCSGRTFVGWSNQEVTDGNKPSVLFTTAENSPAINADTTFYAVFATATGSGSTTDTYDWESTSTGNWLIDESIVRTASQGVSSSFAGKINTAHTYVTYDKKVAVTNFSFQFKRTSNNSNYNVYIETSTDNSNWSAAATYAMNSFGNGSYTSKSQTFDGNTELYVRLHCYNTNAVRYVDNVSITYGSSSYSDYTTSCSTKTVVTLHPDGGAISEDGWETTNGGDTYTKNVETTNDNVVLPTPVKEGYTFDGWYESSTFSGSAVTEIEAGTTGTKEFYAKWTINRYTLTWNLNGGKVIVAGTHASVDATGSPSGYVNYNVTVNAPELAKEGHYFTGWTEDGTNVVTPLTKMPARDVTYIALWEEAGCPEYSFHTGGDNVKEINTQICFEPVGSNNEWQIVNYVIPADTKYFVGHHGYWYENNLGSNNSRSVVKTWSEAMYLAPAMDPSNPNGTPKIGQATGAVGTIRIFDNSNWDNLYVGFIPNGYKLKFSANEYDFVQHENTDYRSEIVEYNGSPTANYSVSVGITDADGNYVKTDHSQEDWRHIFVKDNVGWRNDGAKIGLYYWNNSTSGWCSEFLKSVPGETNLFEGWIPVAATKIKLVRYNSSKGNPGDWNDIWNQTGDISLVTTSNQFTISSWDNQTSGWSTYSSKGRFRMYNDSKSKNWYVHFYPHFVLKYDANGGEGTMEMQAVPKDASDKKVTIADCGFTRTGYNFVKWNKNASGTSTSYNPGATYTLSADVILYAQWEAQTYNITYKDQGNVAYSGSNAASLPNTHTYATATTLVNGVKMGYTFGGWYDNPECTGTAITQLGATDYTADITLYAKWKEKETPKFAWSADSYTAALEADNTFPTLNNPDGLSVTYKSKDENVAKIDANGNIVLGSEGRTTITAIGAESATHKSATDTYELIVVASNCRWVEVEIGDIEPNDEVLVTMKTPLEGNTYTLDHSEGASTYPPAELIEIVGNEAKFLVTSHSNSIWNISGNAIDGYILRPNGDSRNALYCTATKYNVKVGTGTDNLFTIDDGYLKNKTHKVYVGVYSSSDWRHYPANTGNAIAGQTLKFYKRECLDATNYWVTWDAGEGAWEDGSSKKLESYQVGATITAPTEEPTREGYRFDGWTPAPTTMPAKNTTFTAKWTQMHTITWMVGNNSVLTEKVANTTGVTQTPGDDIADDAIGDCANAFVGWSETPLGSTEGQSAPTDLCTATQMKSKYSSVTSNKTFYAVFATKGSGGIAQGTVLWAENFAHFGTNTPSTAGTGTGTTIYGDASITYSQSSNNTKGYNEEIAGGTKPELLLYKGGNHTWTIAGIPTGGAAKMTLSFLSNRTEFNVTSSTTGITVSGSENTWNITANNDVTTFTLTIKNTNSDKNVRIDNVSVVVAEGGVSYSNYVTNCCALAPATNLIVSGTTANSATLTWTAPSSTTGITKLQVRNAETDEVVVNNIAVNTTTATIIELTECTSYQYYVVSVGEDCEVVSNIVTAQPFGNAKTVNYNYNGGSGSVASFTTSCTNQTITLPAATRTGYDFNGWYTAATGGTRVGGANDTYEPATSPVTLYAQWTIKSYTVTWNPNGGNWDGNTSNIVQTYEYGAAINKPDDPTRENGIFKGWTPTPASTMPAGNKTYTAQWEMVYTLTFVDMNAGGTTSTLTQTSSGQNIVAPTANSEVCDMWTFIGWAPSNSLNGGTDKPADFIAAGETILGSQITGNKTYYSVYSYNSDNTQEFEIGQSGTYLMYAISGTTKYYATTAKTGGFYGNPETSFATYGPSKFTLTYNKTENKYIIYHENTTSGKESSGYFELNTYNGDVDVESETPSLFTIQAGSNGAFIIRTDYNTSPRSFGYSSSFTDYSGDNPIYFEPASEIQYYNAANCGEVETYTMSFHNPFGDENALIWYDAEHEESYYTDKPLNTSIDVFPTMVYNGWAFIGWTANQQYNELIGDDNLDDENSATNDPASALIIYSNTAGWSYKLNSNVTMYPVFTKYEDNEDIDLGSGGEYYMYFYREGDYYKDEYFGADNHYKRMYALAGGGDNGEFGYTTNCNNAQIFEFIKEGDGWNIRVKNADGTYPTKSYLVNTNGNDYDLVSTKPSSKWSITKEPEGDYTMWYKGNATNQTTPGFYVAKAREYLGGSSWNFKCYNQDNDASQFYYKVYLGTCENRVFSSNPTNKPTITLNGEPVVTSTQDQSIRARGELSISATKLAANGTITLTSDNTDVYFATDKTANFSKATKPVTPLTLKADEKGKLAMTTVYVHYKPTSTSSLGVQTANITATTGTNGQPDYATATTTAALRNLPADFVIAAKWGDNWYAMPANMDSQSSTEGWLIEVDDAANPTKAIAAPNTTKYGLKSVYTSNSLDDRFADNGERLVFVENVTEITPVANKTLYNGGDASSSKTNIQVYAQYKTATGGYYNTNPDRYEWIPTTTDMIDYTLTSGEILTGDAVGRTVSLDNHGIFGTLLQDKSYNGMVRLLPVDNFYEPIELQVVEWKQYSVSVMYTGAGTKYTTKVGNNAESSAQTLSSIDHAVYSLSTADLTSATNQPLIISIKNDANATIGSIKLTIPAIVATDKSSTALGVAEENAKATSIVVLDGATLTAATTKYTYDDITVYPGGKLVIGQSGRLGMYTLTLRAGSSWGAAEYENKYPQLLVRGDYSNTSGQINLDYVTTQDYYYPLSVPEQVTIADIKYPVEIYGSNVEKANKGSFQFKYYNGAQRVKQGSQYGTGWVVVDEKTTTTLTPNQGYAIWGIPKKINGTRQTYGIHRIPIKKAAADLITNETNDENIAIIAHGDASTPPNDRGWNYLGNPYLAQLGGMDGDDEKLQMGRLIQEMIDGKWTGGWVYNGEQVRYVTLTYDCQTFDAKPVAEATIPAFTTFFIQAAQDGAILLTAPKNAEPASIAARRYAAQQETAKEITTGIILTGNDQTDRTGLLIADNYTEEYDFNADLSKFENSGINLYTIGKDGKLAYMAINQALAEQPIPVGYSAPAEGLYTIAFDEDRYNATDIRALYLIDYDSNEKTNLLHTDYSFVTAAGTNNQRFALQVAFAPENATNVEWVGDATIQVGVEGNELILNNLPTDAAVHVFDALGRLMYHTPHAPTEMQLTLPTGYYLVRIADKQHAAVINTVIP